MFRVLDISDYFLSKNMLTFEKLEGLVYYAQAWHIKLNREPLFQEKFQAWNCGAVNVDILKHYVADTNGFIYKRAKKILNDEYLESFLDSIYQEYGQFSGGELSAMIKSESPWETTREDLKDFEPSFTLIKTECFEKLF